MCQHRNLIRSLFFHVPPSSSDLRTYLEEMKGLRLFTPPPPIMDNGEHRQESS